jgi:heat shock protein HslJ
MDGDGLRLVRSEVTGQLSLALLAGGEWRVTAIDREPLPEGVRPPTVVIEGERIAGFAGCNRFTGAVEETMPGQIAIGPLALTRMACPGPEMEVERRFVAGLAAARRWDYVAGRVVLSGWEGQTVRAVTLARE